MKTIIYSHGFGVDATGRGLFTDIANALPNYNHVTFDYNLIDKQKNQMTVTTLDEQAQKLIQVIKSESSKDNEITIIAHSQGCVITAMVAPENVSQIILLAPPMKVSLGNKGSSIFEREGTFKDANGNLHLPRRDGSTTIISQAYFDSWKNINPVALYNNLSTVTEVSLIRATEDEILESIDIDGLTPDIKILDIAGDHNFTKHRQQLAENIQRILDKPA